MFCRRPVYELQERVQEVQESLERPGPQERQGLLIPDVPGTDHAYESCGYPGYKTGFVYDYDYVTTGDTVI